MKKAGKIRNKMMAGLFAAALLAGTALPVHAEYRDMTVNYTEASTYTLSIPATVNLSETEEVTQTIGVSAVNVATTEQVQIKISSGISDGRVTLTDTKDATNTISSTVSLTTGGEGIADDAVVAAFEGNSTTAVSGGALYFSALGDVYAGSYEGTITFEASIVTKTN
ncbi:MAG: hypothetical protein LUG93_15435 [Lachnospiraceae bacterium]|nr:hypothetical protein [Lachnospiraceae bacterium]